jgi:ADP-ribose pyrophosphatase YjhB (NUDIX family)
MKFCSQCGSDDLRLSIPDGDNRERQVCQGCGTVHYHNPKIVAGCLLTWEGRVLLARRDIQPRRGRWTLPAGFMEMDETVPEAAARECWEEALARPDGMSLYAVFSLSHISQVYMMYRGALRDGRYGVGEESSDAQLFAEAEIPWSELAFPIVERTLKRFFDDRRREQFTVFEESIGPHWPRSLC